MTAILGLAVSSDRVGAVLVRRGAATWSDVRCYDGEESRREVVTKIIASCPRSRWMPRRVIAAIGPSGVQVKQLNDVPAGVNNKALGAIVRESASRFFLKNGEPLETACAPAGQAGAAWAAAYDASLVAEIEQACREARWHLRAVVPFATVLRLAIRDESVAWADGDLRFFATYADANITQVRCERGAAPNAVPLPAPAPAVIDAGVTTLDLLPAFAATQIRRQERLALRKWQPLGMAPSRRQLLIAVVSSVLAIGCWWLAPGLAAAVRTHHAQHDLARIASRLPLDRHDARALDSVTAILGDVSAFETRTRSMTLLLAEITRALPDSCAILQMQVTDSTGGNIVAIAPRAAVIVDALERVPAIAAPTIAGPVASQTLGGRSLERVSVSFRLAP